MLVPDGTGVVVTESTATTSHSVSTSLRSLLLSEELPPTIGHPLRLPGGIELQIPDDVGWGGDEGSVL